MSLFGNLPEVIRAARKKASLTQEALCEAADVSQTALSSYEQGHKHPPTKTFERILVACNVRTLAELQRVIDSLDPARAGEVAEARFSPEDVARAFPGAGEETSRRLASLHEEIAFLMRRVAALESKDPKV